MQFKMMLLGLLGGFSVAGEELEKIETDAGLMVKVPLEHVATAVSHGLVDLDDAMATAEADAERLVREASEAVARAKAAKQAKSSAPPVPDAATVAQAAADAAKAAAEAAKATADGLAAAAASVATGDASTEGEKA